MEKDNSIKTNIVTEENKVKKNVINIIKGFTLAIIFSIIFLTIFAILLTYTTIPESTIMGSTICSRKIKKNGLIYGGIVGFIYIFILYLASSLCLTGFTISTNSFIMLAVGVITGIIGGIVGVNISAKKH